MPAPLKNYSSGRVETLIRVGGWITGNEGDLPAPVDPTKVFIYRSRVDEHAIGLLRQLELESL
jgi:hypothetical protein